MDLKWLSQARKSGSAPSGSKTTEASTPIKTMREGWVHSTCLTSRSPWVQTQHQGEKGKNQQQKQELLHTVQPSHSITQYIIIRS